MKLSSHAATPGEFYEKLAAGACILTFVTRLPSFRAARHRAKSCCGECASDSPIVLPSSADRCEQMRESSQAKLCFGVEHCKR